MKKSILLKILLLILLGTISCESEKDHIQFFDTYGEKFNELRIYLEREYVLNKKFGDEPRIIFINCALDKKTTLVQRCDDTVIQYMNELDIFSINIEKVRSWCDTTKPFTQIRFLLFKELYHPPTYYIYDYCNQPMTDYVSQNVTQRQIDKNWSLLIEK